MHQIDQIKVLVGIPNELYPPPQCDAKLFLTRTMWLKITFVFDSFLDYLHVFDPKKGPHDVGFNVWPYIQEFVYCEQLRGKKIVTITIIRYDSKTLIPFLCSSY